MKRVFQIAGVLTGILMLFFFIQYSNYVIFPTDIGTVFDCSVEEGITSSKLLDISKKYNVTTFTTVYDNTSFFNRKIDFKFLHVNPHDRISFGFQKSLLPMTEVYYEGQSSEVTYIQRFWAVENEDADFNAFVDDLEGNLLEYEQFNPLKLSLLDVLSVQNLHFFMCVFLLLLFCNFEWFRMYCEEVTVPELHERRVFNEITPQLIKNIWQIVTPYLLISSAFGAYVLLRNFSFIFDYIKTFIVFGLTLFGIQIICAGLAFTIARKVAISSFTGKEKCSFFVALFLVFELIAACLFIISSQKTYFNIMDIAMFEQGSSVIDNFSPTYITTSKIPDETSTEQLLSVFDEIDTDDVYNYAHPTNSLGYKELCNKEARDQMYWNSSTVRMSYNMLDYVPIYESNGTRLGKEDFNQGVTTLLIPEHLKENTENILQNFYNGQSFEVYFIQSNQEHFDILDPSRKVLNAKYMLTPVEKNIYYTNGEVLYDEDIATVIEQILGDYGFDQGTISLKKLSEDYEVIGDELKLNLIGDGLLWSIDTLFFFSVTFFGGIAFCSFRKKVII